MATKLKVQSEKSEVKDLSQKPVDQVEKELAEAKEQAVVFEGKYRRALADYANLERQTSEDRSRFSKIATQLFVEQMLVPFDHLLLASAHLKDKGLDLVIAQFKQLFESQGLKELNVMGQAFDPDKMEAVGTKAGEVDKVLEVTQAGYELNGVVVRPAKVIVGTK